MRLNKNLLLWALGCLLSSCSANLIDEPVEERGNLNASRYVAIGSTETSGFNDGALYRTGQQNSYPALIARQIEATGSITFKQPLVVSDSGVAFSTAA